MLIISLFDIAGTIAFAISGALTAMEKKLDLFGVFIIALVTSIGGGTLRDMLIGNTPVNWLLNLQSFYIVFAMVLVTIVFRNKLNYFRTSLLLFDTIGLSVFTIIGIQKGLMINLSPIVCILLGTITACFGGVIRDILCNEIPILFRKEIYATACVLGGIFFFFLKAISIEEDLAYILCISSIIILRLLSVYFKWSLPQIKL